MTIEEIRADWEEGLTAECVLPSTRQGNILVVLSHVSWRGQPETTYHCHRYFPIGNDWTCSVDKQRVALEEVWSWLEKNRSEN